MIFVATLITAVIGIALFALMARQLLGLRFGLVRGLVAGLLALLVVGPITRAMARAVPGDLSKNTSVTPLWFMILGVACALLVAMVFLVVAEALVPSGSLPGPVEAVRGLRGRLARTRRYSQISRIILRHGLGPYLRGRRRGGLEQAAGRARLARSLRQALDEGGVTFVKLGQVLSTRRDLLPEEFIEELSRLTDQATPVPWDELEPVLAGRLDRPVDEVFAEFDRRPLAAASVAQVHAARLRSGAEVVVKVQRPGLRRVVERDLDIVRRLAGTLERRTRWGRGVGAVALAGGFAEALREELDFRVEARNMAAVSATGPAVGVPVPHPELSGERVLVMQRLDGVPLAAAGPAIDERGLDRVALATALLDALLRQIMLDGVFHADPHPGNILLLADDRLGLLDFGSVGRLDGAVRAALQRLLLAMDRGDPLGLCDALLEVVARPDEVDEQSLERELGRFMGRHLSAGSVPDARMFADLLRIITRHRLAVPPEMAAVFRALATVEGTLTQLSPGFDLVAAARDFAARHLADQLRPEALRRAAVEELAALVPMLRRWPRRLDRIAGALEHGRFGVHVRLLSDERGRRTAAGLLHQVLLAFLAATAGIMAVLLLGTANGPAVTASVSLYQFLGYCLLVVCGILALRVLVLIFRRDP